MPQKIFVYVKQSFNKPSDFKMCETNFHPFLQEKCSEDHHIKPFLEKLHSCNDRVNSRSQTTETCVEELFDYLHHLDHCVQQSLFSKLK